MKAQPEKPRCPFCYHAIEQPQELPQRKIVEFPVGICNHCGAVYAYDVTGHNMGAAFLEALLVACNYDSDLAFSLSYGEDYMDEVIEQYDSVTHTITPDKIVDERFIRGALIFVRLIDEFKEITEPKVRERLKARTPLKKTKRRSEKFSKGIVRTYVQENRIEDLLALSEEDTRVVNELQRMLYTPDDRLRWNVIDLLAKVAERVGKTRPDIISKFLSQLIQNASYPGASAWGALEAAGAIISANTELYGEFSPTILAFLQNKDLRKEVTWAIGKIATVQPGLVKYAFRSLRSFLSDQDPSIRGYAAWALGYFRYSEIMEELEQLADDVHTVMISRNDILEEVTVGALAKESMHRLTQ
jgi:HEAT repeat protein